MYIKVTHANLNTPVYVRTDEVLLAYYSEGNKCTHLMVKSLYDKGQNAVWPVKESPDEIVHKIKTLEARMAEAEEKAKVPGPVPEC